MSSSASRASQPPRPAGVWEKGNPLPPPGLSKPATQPPEQTDKLGEKAGQIAPSFSQEQKVLEGLHKQGGIVTEMVGTYNPDVRDPSHSMLRIATRDWDTAKLEQGCRLLQDGVGLNPAARQAGVLVGDLKEYWQQHFHEPEHDGYGHGGGDYEGEDDGEFEDPYA